MNFESMTPRLKLEILESAVLYGTPEEVSEIYKQLGEMPFTARALGYACRYRGLDMVKALVERGASFAYDVNNVNRLYAKNGSERKFGDGFIYYSLMLLNTNLFNIISSVSDLEHMGRTERLEILPLDERLAVLDHLCADPHKTRLDINELLYYAFFTGELEMVSMLKAHGAVFSEERKKIFTQDPNSSMLNDFYDLLSSQIDSEFALTAAALSAETGGFKLPVNQYMFDRIMYRFSPPLLYDILRFFNLSKVSLWNMVTKLIHYNDIDKLNEITSAGIIQNFKDCRRLINFAERKNRVECTALLLDYMNRTFDIAAERKKEALKAEDELDESGLPTEPV